MEARRFFFHSSNQKARPLARQAEAHAYIAPRTLRKLGDGRLRNVVPVIEESLDWKLGASRLHHWNEVSRSWERFRDLKPTESLVVRMILSSIPLSEIAARLRSVSSLSEGEAWETVKSLFLDLAEAGFCRSTESSDTH